MGLAAGVLAFALSVVLGITSLPSVTSSLTWKEFTFVQSKLGWTALFLACSHDLLYGWHGWTMMFSGGYSFTEDPLRITRASYN